MPISLKNIIAASLFLILLLNAVVLDISCQTISELINKYNASNGFDKLPKIKTVCIHGENLLKFDRELKFKYTAIIKVPNKLFTRSKVFGHTTISGFDGIKEWSDFATHDTIYKNIDLIQDRLEAGMYNLSSFYDQHLIKSCSIDTFHKKQYYKLIIETPDQFTLICYLDTGKFFLEDIQFPLIDPKSGDLYVNEILFSDYKKKRGISIAFKKEHFLNGKLTRTEIRKRITLNRRVKDKIFLDPSH